MLSNEDEDGAYDWPSDPIGNQISSVEESLLCPICQVDISLFKIISYDDQTIFFS